MNSDVKEIESIIFGVLSTKEIIDMSVCEVNNTRLLGPGSVYDERMGCNTEMNIQCVTCGMLPRLCPGHFAFIKLNEYIIHPLFYKYVVSLLRCFCINCNRLLILEDQITICGLNKSKNDRRFKKILEKLEKIEICAHCDNPQPKIVYTITDNSITMVYKESVNIDEEGKSIKKKDNKISISLTADEIKKSFDAYLDEDVILCGFDPTRMHPRNLIMTHFPVIPPCARPFVLADGNICDDDLTNQILEIIKANNTLKKNPDEKDDNQKIIAKKLKALQSLKFRISTFYNNCLSPETPVLLWDGTIKRADEIKIGDILIGDDGEKRQVKYTCEGEDTMYEISQEKGDIYIVNSNHILTLRFSSHKKIFWVKPNKNTPLGSWWIKWYDNKLKKIKNKIVSVTKKRNTEESLLFIEKFRDTILESEVFDIYLRDYLELSKNINVENLIKL